MGKKLRLNPKRRRRGKTRSVPPARFKPRPPGWRDAFVSLRPWLLLIGFVTMAYIFTLPGAFSAPGWLSSEPQVIEGRFTRCGRGRGYYCVVDGDTFKLGDTSVRVVGIEQTDSQRAFSDDHHVDTVPALDDLPPDLRFDLVIANQVLEHVVDPIDVLRSLHARLSTGGVLYASVPNFGEYDWSAAQRQLDAGGHLIKEVSPWEHLNYFDVESFRSMVEVSGFDVVPDPVQKRAERWLRRRLHRLGGLEIIARAR